MVIINFTNHLNQKIEIKIAVNQSITIGRTSKANIETKDGLMSGVHFSFHFDGKKIIAKDLNSKNGVFLNGIKIDESEFFFEDLITAGKCTFQLLEQSVKENKSLVFPGLEMSELELKDATSFLELRNTNKSQQQISLVIKDLAITDSVLTSRREEYGLRKKAKTKIVLSKDELKLQQPMRSFMANLFDILFPLFFFVSPFVFFNWIEKKK